jgi:spermidine/putrescine-binding protein
MENFITQIGRTRMGRLRNESLAEENRTILSRSNAVRNLDDLGQQENRENLARSSVKYFSDENIAANISSATDNISRLRPKSIASTTDGSAVIQDLERILLYIMLLGWDGTP